MKLYLGEKKKGTDYFGRFLNDFIAVSLDTTGKDRPFYSGITLGTVFNKALEIEVEYSKVAWQLFHIGFSLSLKGDHCGPSFDLSILGFEFNIQIYDCRHWNWEANRFYTEGEEMCQYEARKKNTLAIKPQLDAIRKQMEELEEQREQLLEKNKLGEC